MDRPPLEPSPAIVNDFLARYVADRERGDVQELEVYQALYPGFEGAIAEALRSVEAPEPSPDDSSGHETVPDGLIGPYRLLEEIGHGGQGRVFLARHEELKRRVALKVLHLLSVQHPLADLRFDREAEIASRLDHPGVCTVYESGSQGNLRWIAMRYVDGSSLHDLIQRARAVANGSGAISIPAREAASGNGSGSTVDSTQGASQVARITRMIEDVARALHTAHEAGLVHRDVKPGNIMIDRAGRPVVLDFGMAKDVEHDLATLTGTGDIVGTPAYLSPEQLRADQRSVDRRTDVYSLGATLFECLTLRRPFEAPTRDALYRAIATEEPSNVRRLRPGIPTDLSVVLATALEKEPARRYQTALEFAEELRRVRQHEPIVARPPGPVRRVEKWARRHPGVATLTTVIAVLLVAALGWTLHKNRELDDARRLAVEDARERAQQAARLRRLSDLWLYERLTARLETLGPALPENVERLRSWVDDADGLVSRLAVHERRLRELRASGRSVGPDTAPSWEFENTEQSWEHDRLTHLIRGVSEMTAAETGRLGVVRAWLGHALEAEQRTLLDHTAAWKSAIEDIASDSRYGNVELRPQIGLVPLGRDPRSGLHEFLHLMTHEGPPPSRDENGDLGPPDGMGIVLVLLPGDRFWMGAQDDDPAGRNYVPRATADTKPVHEVSLDPFFLAKHELTRGQWWRVDRKWMPQQIWKEERKRRPSNMMTWYEARTLLSHAGLVLPAEAQWEYACRAGKASPWSHGETASSLEGLANLAGNERSEVHRNPVGGVHRDRFVNAAPVGSFPPNAFGLYDMLGNVYEWCRGSSPPYDSVAPGPRDGYRFVAERKIRSRRGGCYKSLADRATFAARSAVPADHRRAETGLRAARAVER